MANSPFFRSSADESPQIPGGGLTFTGNGQEYLPVPGLATAERVFIGGQEIPKEITENVLIDTSEKAATEAVTVPLWVAEKRGGVLHIRRGIKSNDGIWQQGAQILVIGKKAEAEKTEPAKPADDKKSDPAK